MSYQRLSLTMLYVHFTELFIIISVICRPISWKRVDELVATESTGVSMDTSNQQIFARISISYTSGRADKNQVSRSRKQNQVSQS
jgi:hypothetical protein